MDDSATRSSSAFDGDVVGMLILIELKGIRQDIKDEIRSLREDIKHSLGEKHGQTAKELFTFDNTNVDGDIVGTTDCIPSNTQLDSVSDLFHSINSTLPESAQGSSLIESFEALSPMKSSVWCDKELDNPVKVEFVCEELEDSICDQSEPMQVPGNYNTRYNHTAVDVEVIRENSLFLSTVAKDAAANNIASYDSLQSSMRQQLTKKKNRKKITNERKKQLMVLISSLDQDEKKKISCTYCKKTFKSKHRLKKHASLHTGENPYKCEFCYQNFAFGPQLKQHLHSVHKHMNCIEDFETGSFYCVHCKKSFKSKKSSKVHIRTYTGKRPFKCVYCDTGFILKSYLNKHLHAVHGDMPALTAKKQKGKSRRYEML